MKSQNDELSFWGLMSQNTLISYFMEEIKKITFKLLWDKMLK